MNRQRRDTHNPPWRVIVLMLTVLALDACTPSHTLAPVSPPVEDRSTTLPGTGAPPVSPAEPAVPVTPGAPTPRNPAVIALINESDARLSAGRPEPAAAALERALRLSPHDPYLWHRLARVRLLQHQWRQAVAMARKSDALAAADAALHEANRRIIAEAVSRMQPDPQ